MESLSYEKIIKDIDTFIDYSYELEKKLKAMISSFEELISSDDFKEEPSKEFEMLESSNQKMWEQLSQKAKKKFERSKKWIENDNSKLTDLIILLDEIYQLYHEANYYYEDLKNTYSKYLDTRCSNDIEKYSYEVKDLMKNFKPNYKRLKEYSLINDTKKKKK